MFSLWSLTDSKSTQISRNLPSILTVLSNTVGWIVSTCPFISKSIPYINLLVIVPRAPITIGHFHVPHFFQFPSKVHVLIFFFLFHFLSILHSNRPERQSSQFGKSSFLLLEGLVVCPRLDDPFYYYHHFASGEFFTASLVGYLSPKSDWQNVSSNAQDPTLYSIQSYQCSALDGLNCLEFPHATYTHQF